MKSIRSIVYILCALLFSCHENSKSGQDQDHPFSKEVPLTEKGELTRAYIYQEKVSEKLKLESLEKGFDSIQIRIWHTTFGDTLQILSIIKSHGIPLAYLGTYNVFVSENHESIDTVVGKRVEISPISGWESFFRKLFNLEITTLEDMSKIDKSLFVSDVDGFGIEISTKDKYRVYNFLDPRIYTGSVTQKEKMLRILQFLEQEFNLSLLSK